MFLDCLLLICLNGCKKLMVSKQLLFSSTIIIFSGIFGFGHSLFSFASSFWSIFVKIARRRNAHLQKYPDSKVISLGIGDTTEPIPEVITSAMAKVRLPSN